MRQEMVLLQQLKGISEGLLDAEAYVQVVRESNQTYIQEAMQVVYQNKPEELNGLLKSHRRVRKVIASMPRTEKEAFVYECGIFNGAYKVLQEMGSFYAVQEDRRDMLKVLERQHVSDILVYLHNNSDARHGEIARRLKISPSYLSEILNLLMRKGYVERYGRNKGTRYVLTREGRMLYRIYAEKKRPKTTAYIDVDYKEIQDKEKFLMGQLQGHEKSNLSKEDGYEKWRKGFRTDSKPVVL